MNGAISVRYECIDDVESPSTWAACLAPATLGLSPGIPERACATTTDAS